jgi:hypothetical protein
MSVRIKTFKTEQELAKWMTDFGVGLGSIEFFNNSSGQPGLFYEDPGGETIIAGRLSPGGVSIGVAAGAGTIEVKASRTVVVTEVVGAISGNTVSDTLANTYVTPGSVVLTDSGGVGETIIDNAQGQLVTEGSLKPRGTINYGTGAVAFTYPETKAGTGNLQADYTYSAFPDSSNPSDMIEIQTVAVTGAGGNITFTIYCNSGETVPCATGVITVVGGEGVLSLDRALSPIMDTDLTKRDRRWVAVDGACTFFMFWQTLS